MFYWILIMDEKQMKLEAMGQCIPPPTRLTSAAIWRISMSSRFMSVNHFPFSQ